MNIFVFIILFIFFFFLKKKKRNLNDNLIKEIPFEVKKEKLKNLKNL